MVKIPAGFKRFFALSVFIIAISLFTGCSLNGKTVNDNWDKLLEGTWFVTYMDDPEWNDYGTLTFDTDTHEYHAYNGCNRMSGTYHFKGNNIIFDSAPSTSMFCECEGIFGIPEFDTPHPLSKINLKNSNGVLVGKKDPFASILRREGKWMLEGSWTIINAGYSTNQFEEIIFSFNTKSNTVILQKGAYKISIPFVNFVGTELKFLTENISKSSFDKFGPEIKSILESVIKFSPKPINNGCSVGINLLNKEGSSVSSLQRVVQSQK